MLKNNAINILGTFAALALSLLFLARAAAPAETQPRNSSAYAAKRADAVVIQALPPDAIIIQALPAND
ncbi:MAG TPA: hypothetical protein VMX79_02990 [bacterium]|nr:hypothetical protein [bacterium]